MYKQCAIILLALDVGLAHSISWDIVVARINLVGKNRIEFYNEGKLTYFVQPPKKFEIKWLSYDPINKRLLIFSKKSLIDSVLSFNLTSLETQTLIKKNPDRDFSTIAYDPVTGLFFGIFDKIIYSFVVKPDNDIDEKTVINLLEDKSDPRGIVVDSSCGGYIYWTSYSKTNVIERVRFNGLDKEAILESSDMTRNGLVIDPQTKKMYWIESQKGVNKFSILRADLNGKNVKKIYSEECEDTDNIPNQLTVSNDFIYWGNSIVKYFWQLPSNPQPDAIMEPKRVLLDNTKFKLGLGFHGIATNYKINEHAEGIPNCKAMTSSDSITVSTDISLVCVHGTKVSGESRCECTQGYSGETCDVSACQNYCIQGDCTLSTEGLPKCRCNAGYSGAKCEVNACQEYCFNNGICSLDDDSEPVCQCTSHYDGDRCDAPIFLNQCPANLNTDVKPVALGKELKSTSASRLPRMTVTWKNGAS